MGGVVDHGDYLAAFAAYESCMARGGDPVTVTNDEGTILEMRIPSEAIASGVDDRCYQTEFKAVNEAWQVANQDQLADNVLLDTCLVDHGLSRPTTRQSKVDALLDAGVDLGSCLEEE